jgi:DNA polymerase III sliding clamp (beta) subunit (PCNA family)
MIHTQEDSVSITSGSTDKGNAKVTIPAVVTGEKQSIGINGKYISDFIRNTSASDIHIHIVDEQKPLVLKDPHEDNYTYVARPLLK